MIATIDGLGWWILVGGLAYGAVVALHAVRRWLEMRRMPRGYGMSDQQIQAYLQQANALRLTLPVTQRPLPEWQAGDSFTCPRCKGHTWGSTPLSQDHRDMIYCSGYIGAGPEAVRCGFQGLRAEHIANTRPTALPGLELPTRLLCRCAGCGAVLGMIEPVPAIFGHDSEPWAACSWLCLEAVVAKGQEEAREAARLHGLVCACGHPRARHYETPKGHLVCAERECVCGEERQA